METHVINNEWGQIVHHPDLATLELRWTPAGPAMTDAAFKATLCLFVSQAERFRCPRLLVDAARFSHAFGGGVMEWRDAAIIPRYGGAGTQRFAFVMPGGFPGIGSEGTEGPATFPTAWFGSRPDAIAWLQAG